MRAKIQEEDFFFSCGDNKQNFYKNKNINRTLLYDHLKISQKEHIIYLSIPT